MHRNALRPCRLCGEPAIPYPARRALTCSGAFAKASSSLADIGAAGLGEIGFAAAAAADDGGELADEITGLDSIGEVVGDSGEQGRLAA